MNTANDTSSVYTDFSGLSQLKADVQQNSPEAIREVARQFESVFIQMMMKSMRDASEPFESGLFGDSSTKTYTDMYDKQLSIEMTKLQGIGLADVIMRQLSPPAQSVDPATTLDDYTANPVTAAQSVQTTNDMLATTVLRQVQSNAMTEDTVQVNAVTDDAAFAVSDIEQPVNWATPQDFIRDSWPHALRAGNALNIDPRVLIAQSALETGWGSRVHPTVAGESSFCLFGIKADQRWDGSSVDFQTLEFRSGAMQRETASFRAYDSMADAYDDYVNFLQSNPRYADVLRSVTPTDYANGLQKAGYATDPDYADKIERIRNGNMINDTVSELKLSTDVSLT